MKLTQAPIFRMYHLTIAQQDQPAFASEGTHNMFTSFENEPGTLMMYATHDDELGESNFVFELYQDMNHYQIHADSPQFKQYGQLAQKVLTGREMFELHPELIMTTDSIKTNGKNEHMVLSEFTLNSDADEFQNNLNKLTTNDIGTAVYVATKNKQKGEWISLEVNPADNSVLQQLIQKFQITKTKRDLIVDTMVNRPNIEYNL